MTSCFYVNPSKNKNNNPHILYHWCNSSLMLRESMYQVCHVAVLYLRHQEGPRSLVPRQFRCVRAVFQVMFLSIAVVKNKKAIFTKCVWVLCHISHLFFNHPQTIETRALVPLFSKERWHSHKFVKISVWMWPLAAIGNNSKAIDFMLQKIL